MRHGHLPEREVMTGIGPVSVKVPRVRDRAPGEDKIAFTPSILPRYLRKATSVEELLAMTDGFRESTPSWRELLLDLKQRGLKQDPKLAIPAPPSTPLERY